MANTYKLISSNTLTTTAASITFSSIPSTYTDLLLMVSARSNSSSTARDSIRLYFNGSTSSVYSFTRLLGDGTTLSSFSSPVGDELYSTFGASTSLSTASVFGSVEIYIPNYLSTTNKPTSSFQVVEDNNATGYFGLTAGLAQITSAITSIEVALNPSASFVSDSSFYLYGIKNS